MNPIPNLFNYIIPQYCILCDFPEKPICSKCLRRLFKSLPQCYLCGSISTKYRPHQKCLSLRNGPKFEAVYSCWRLDREGLRVLRKIRRKMLFTGIQHLSEVALPRFRTSSIYKEIHSSTVIHVPTSDNSGVEYSKLVAEKIAGEWEEKAGKTLIVADRLVSKQIEKVAREVRGDKLYALCLFSNRKPVLFDKIRDVNVIES